MQYDFSYILLSDMPSYTFESPENFRDSYEDMAKHIDSQQEITGEWADGGPSFKYNLSTIVFDDCVYDLDRDFDALYSTLHGSRTKPMVVNIKTSGKPVQFEYIPSQ
ncbi:hypothetical protein INT43_005773 [Umbelopsis isabellina]|uniref:Uncharacterized protein n=1 Tax=Mortierella isabellina TaxID=91625 RepID=A0A8H7PJ62_MORIS|nr:hypothetical protein INT43_005773 [Umbelopsis isabellina]